MHSQDLLAAGGTAFAFAHADAHRWTIGNDLVAKTVAWSHEQGLYLFALDNRQSGWHWQPDLSADSHAGGEFSLCWNGEQATARLATKLLAVQAQSDTASVTLQFDLRLAGALDISLFYRVHAGAAVIEQWLQVIPLQSGTLSRVAPLTLSVAPLSAPILHWVRGLQGHGWHMPASGPYPAYQVCHQPLGEVTLESGLRSTWHEIAWLALDSDVQGGEGMFVGLLYSGRWSAHAAATGKGAAALTLVSEGYATPLSPGEQWAGPHAFTGLYQGDLDAAAHVQHTYMRAAVLPATPDNFPWVQYNTWFAHLVDIDEAILCREAILAAQLGCEVFVIDAGWWEPSLRTSDNFTTGLGCWRPSAEKFPSGLEAFADFVRSLGMRFGIWVEPERVDLRQSAGWQLRWLARDHDAIISPPWPPDTVSGWLCFGHPDVQAWAIDWLSGLIAALGPEWLKWDSNWWGVCTCTDHGHSASDGEFHQVQGVHNVLSELRRRFPTLVIENCAGGGTRTDFAMLANTHATWLHDASTPNHRVRFHMAGANYLFPPEVCNAFVIDAEDEPLTDPATPRPTLDTIARSRMLGAFGVSARLGEWSATAVEAVRTAIVQYKQLRPLLKNGHFYHLLPQTTLDCPRIEPQGQWEAYALLDSVANQGAIWVFRAQDGETVRVIQLAGLAFNKSYRYTDYDTGETVTATGERLIQEGITVTLHERTSALIFIHSDGEAGEVEK